MLSIRAESGIPASIHDLDLTIFQTLEISVFPGCEYCIHVEITSQVLEMLHSYFEISEQTMIDEDEVGEGVSGSISGGVCVVDEKRERLGSNESERRVHSKEDDQQGGVFPVGDHDTDSLFNLAGASSDSTLSPRYSSKQLSDDHLSISIPSQSDCHSLVSSPLQDTPPHPSMTTPAPTTTVTSSTRRQEALFIKYLRVGHIAVEVNTIGFAFNLERYHAIVNEFSLRNKVLDWHRLIWKFEKHIALCMTSHTASSSMNKLWTIMFGGGSADGRQGDVGGIKKYHDDDTVKKKRLLLGE
jgi:hypothetical protein